MVTRQIETIVRAHLKDGEDLRSLVEAKPVKDVVRRRVTVAGAAVAAGVLGGAIGGVLAREIRKQMPPQVMLAVTDQRLLLFAPRKQGGKRIWGLDSIIFRAQLSGIELAAVPGRSRRLALWDRTDGEDGVAFTFGPIAHRSVLKAYRAAGQDLIAVDLHA